MATSTFVVDGVFITIVAFGVLLFAAIVFLLVYFVVRYRRSRNPEPAPVGRTGWLEVLWIALPTALVLAMFFYGLTGFTFLRRVPAGAMDVKVTARQWSWLFTYANGRTSPDLVVPVDRDVRLLLGSLDVIHGFFAPALRIKQDAVPGMTTQVWFRAVETGTTDILCTQYCGLRHSAMLARLAVVPQDVFAAWYAGEPVTIAGLVVPASPGERLLQEKGCLGCHSVDGSRIDGPTFKGLYGSSVRVQTGGEVRTVVVDEAYCRTSLFDPGADVVVGYPNAMPSEKGRVSDQEFGEILAYLEQLGVRAAEGNAEAGSADTRSR